MLNDIITAYNGTTGVWETAKPGAVKKSEGDFKAEFAKATRTDTVEFSNSTKPTQAATQTLKSAKADLASELSGIHADVNKFLAIKEQVQSGTYELNANEIAKSITNYSIY
ncbi:MAG: flagellar biosynthesis anti-sigma factor FlgM [Oscillospiraceae bacterium]|nr:flagellar biosynthesis anti-sigma factor FlgM [Oscillospiraceae bacterium]